MPDCTDLDGRTLINDMASSTVSGVSGAMFVVEDPIVVAIEARVDSVC